MKSLRGSRLTKRADFRYVFERPTVSSDRCFRILRRANDRGHCRLGMAVSLKVSRKAVSRNRLKRVIRESFRTHQEALAAHGGWDIVVLPSARAASICNSELNNFLESQWREIGKRSPPEQDESRMRTKGKNTDHG